MNETEFVPDQRKTSRLFKEIATIFRFQAAGGTILAVFWLYEFLSQSNLPIYLSDSVLSLLAGALGGVSLWLFLHHRGTAVISASLFSVLILNAYSLVVSRGLNIILTVFEIIILLCLVVLKNRKEL